MNKLIAIILILSCSWANALSVDTAFENENYLFARLLLSGNDKNIRQAAKSMYDIRIDDIDTLDLAAELLSANMLSKNEPKIKLDSMIWLAKAIGKPGNRRYETLIRELLSPAMAIGRHAKHINPLVDNFNDSPFETFVPNPDIVEKLRIKLSNNPTNPKGMSEKFTQLQIGASLENIFSLIGTPNSITSAPSKVINLRFGGGINLTSLSLRYDGYGIIYIVHHKTGNPGWKVDLVSNIYMLMKGVKDQETLELAELILSDNWKAIIRRLSQQLSDKKVLPQVVYDIAMERLLRSTDAKADFEEKMLAFMAKFVASSNNKRYLNSLVFVSKNTLSRAVKKHATSSAKRLKKKGSDGEEYIAGSVDIGKYTTAGFGSTKRFNPA